MLQKKAFDAAMEALNATVDAGVIATKEKREEAAKAGKEAIKSMMEKIKKSGIFVDAEQAIEKNIKSLDELLEKMGNEAREENFDAEKAEFKKLEKETEKVLEEAIKQAMEVRDTAKRELDAVCEIAIEIINDLPNTSASKRKEYLDDIARYKQNTTEDIDDSKSKDQVNEAKSNGLKNVSDLITFARGQVAPWNLESTITATSLLKHPEDVFALNGVIKVKDDDPRKGHGEKVTYSLEAKPDSLQNIPYFTVQENQDGFPEITVASDTPSAKYEFLLVGTFDSVLDYGSKASKEVALTVTIVPYAAFWGINEVANDDEDSLELHICKTKSEVAVHGCDEIVNGFGSAESTPWNDDAEDITTVKIDTAANEDSTIEFKNTSYLFAGLSSCSSWPSFENLNTSKAKNMNNMFEGCTGFESSGSILDTSKLNTGVCENFHAMFKDCNCPTIDVSGFDTKFVKDMSNMFDGCSAVTQLIVSNFDTSACTNMSCMFKGVKNIVERQNLDISKFKTNLVTDMSYMFSGCEKINGLDLTNFETDNVMNMKNMFKNCKTITTLGINNFKTSKVTDMSYMFSECEQLTTLDLMGFDTSVCTNMSYMFSGCYKMSLLDLSSFETSNVGTMEQMFRDCLIIDTINLSNFKTDKLERIEVMFFNVGVNTTYGTYINFGPSFDTSKIIAMDGMFRGGKFRCSTQAAPWSANRLDISSFSNQNLLSVYQMFCGCASLEEIYVNSNKWQRKGYQNMNETFSGCANLKSRCLQNPTTEFRHGLGSAYDSGRFAFDYTVPGQDNEGLFTDISLKPR